jgi:hypothetical protein
VRVPRVNLLDRFASVDKSGRYSSPLTSEVGVTAALCLGSVCAQGTLLLLSGSLNCAFLERGGTTLFGALVVAGRQWCPLRASLCVHT